MDADPRVLSDADIANGYAKITRTSGTNTFLAYAVVVDGGSPQTRSDDGAFVGLQVQEPPASPEFHAIRKVEAKSRTLLTLGPPSAQGRAALAEKISPLEYVRQIAAYMGTLPEYDFTGVDERFLVAYGVFKNGWMHVVGHNRELGDESALGALAGGRESLGTPELPGSGYARVLQAFGNRGWAHAPVNALSAMLENPGGYAIRPGCPATRGSRLCAPSRGTGTSSSTRTAGRRTGRGTRRARASSPSSPRHSRGRARRTSPRSRRISRRGGSRSTRRSTST